MLQIPITESANQEFSVDIAGRNVRFNLRYQDIGAGWFVDVSIDGVPVLAGSRVNSGARVLGSLALDFEGDFVPIPKGQTAGELLRDSWNNTHVLLYLTDAELQETGLEIL